MDIGQWLQENWAVVVEPVVQIAALVFVAFVLHVFTKRWFFHFLRKLANKVLFPNRPPVLDEQPFERLALVVPFIVIQMGTQFLGSAVAESIQSLIQRVAMAIVFILVARVIAALLDNVNDVYMQKSIASRRPIKGYLQVVVLIVYIVTLILAISSLIDRSPVFFLSGLGAMTAVLMLVFRDTILSLVAGIQLTSNDLLRMGDWIEMPQFNANGPVTDIALNVVKVQNWDMTITVIPAHKFIEHSFKNWRGMEDSGGRRIQRAIFLDLQSIHFLSEEEITRFEKFRILKSYIQEKREQLRELNQGSQDPLKANVGHLTNLGTFRAYISQYLKNHPDIHQDMTFLIRQLPPGPEGLPMEVYVFSKEIRWAKYEAIQSDIFDHLLAIVPEFGLRVFQQPSGLDLKSAFSQRISEHQDQ